MGRIHCGLTAAGRWYKIPTQKSGFAADLLWKIIWVKSAAKSTPTGAYICVRILYCGSDSCEHTLKVFHFEQCQDRGSLHLMVVYEAFQNCKTNIKKLVADRPVIQYRVV